MGFVTRKTNGGETWADLATRAYGDVTKIKDLIADNPHAPARPVLPGGLTILFRIIPREQAGGNFANLPPWKKSV